MDVYMHATADTPPDAAAQNFIDISHLYRIGFLDDSSTVWINADAPENGMWTLTNRSTFVKVFRTVYPGWVRLTRSHARWGRTARETTSNEATHIIDLREIRGEDDPNATIIVIHRDSNSTVGVLADGDRKHLRNGTFDFDPFTLIDINNYVREEHKTPSPYVAAHAMLNGAAIMSSTAVDGGDFIRKNMELFRTEFGAEHIQFLDSQWNKIEEYARYQTEILVKKIKVHGQEETWNKSSELV